MVKESFNHNNKYKYQEKETGRTSGKAIGGERRDSKKEKRITGGSDK